MISTDRKMFDPDSPVAKRTVALGNLLDDLRVIVFTKKSENLAAIRLGTHTSVHPTNSASRWQYAKDAIEIGRLAGKADIITAQDPFETGYAGVKIAEALKTPLQLQVHTDFLSPAFQKLGFLNKIRVRVATRTIPKAACIRVVSNRVAKGLVPMLEKSGRQIPITTIPVFTNVDNFINGPSTSLKTAHPEFNFIIVTSARLESEKNIGIGLEAIADLVREYPGIGYFIMGDGAERKSLERKARSLGIGKNVIFMGWVNDPAPMLRAADCFLFTSDFEGYGLSLVEAAAANLPIVTTDVGIVGDVLKDGESCQVCQPGDATCITEKIYKYLKDPSLREKHRNAAKQAISHLENKTIEQYAKEIKETFTSCSATPVQGVQIKV